MPAAGFRCSRAAWRRGDAIILRFSLVRLDDGVAWRWTYPDPATEFLQIAAHADHLVAILPRELAGDIRGNFEPERLSGALIVAAPRANALRTVLPRSRPASENPVESQRETARHLRADHRTRHGSPPAPNPQRGSVAGCGRHGLYTSARCRERIAGRSRSCVRGDQLVFRAASRRRAVCHTVGAATRV